jgi:hypothetical protein
MGSVGVEQKDKKESRKKDAVVENGCLTSRAPYKALSEGGPDGLMRHYALLRFAGSASRS